MTNEELSKALIGFAEHLRKLENENKEAKDIIKSFFDFHTNSHVSNSYEKLTANLNSILDKAKEFLNEKE